MCLLYEVNYNWVIYDVRGRNLLTDRGLHIIYASLLYVLLVSSHNSWLTY